MAAYLEIEKVIGREILDSRGNPTVEAEEVVSAYRFSLKQNSFKNAKVGIKLHKDNGSSISRNTDS